MKSLCYTTWYSLLLWFQVGRQVGERFGVEPDGGPNGPPAGLSPFRRNDVSLQSASKSASQIKNHVLFGIKAKEKVWKRRVRSIEKGEERETFESKTEERTWRRKLVRCLFLFQLNLSLASSYTTLLYSCVELWARGYFYRIINTLQASLGASCCAQKNSEKNKILTYFFSYLQNRC